MEFRSVCFQHTALRIIDGFIVGGLRYIVLPSSKALRHHGSFCQHDDDPLKPLGCTLTATEWGDDEQHLRCHAARHVLLVDVCRVSHYAINVSSDALYRLYGVLLHQTYNYMRVHFADSRWIKGYVSATRDGVFGIITDSGTQVVLIV